MQPEYNEPYGRVELYIIEKGKKIYLRHKKYTEQEVKITYKNGRVVRRGNMNG